MKEYLKQECDLNRNKCVGETQLFGHVVGREGSGVRSNFFTSYETLKKLLNPVSFRFPIYKRVNNRHVYLSSHSED